MREHLIGTAMHQHIRYSLVLTRDPDAIIAYNN